MEEILSIQTTINNTYDCNIINNNYNNTFNYFKIYSLLNIKCKIILENLFKSRWVAENKGEDWINNSGYSILLIGRLFNYDTGFNDIQKSKINCNNLEDWDIELLSLILENFKYLTLERDIVNIQNKQISKIKTIYLKVIKLKELKEYKFIDDKEYYLTLKELKESIFTLDPINSINKLDINDYESIFQDQLYNSIENNSVQEKQTKKFKDLGNIQYKLKYQFNNSNNPYLKAIEYYDIALKQPCISNITKSTLFNNKSICLIEYYKTLINHHINYNKGQSNDQTVQNNQLIYKLLENGIDNAINSILASPLNIKGYYRLGQALLVSNDHSNALNCFNVALNFGDPNIKESNELIQIITNIKNK